MNDLCKYPEKEGVFQVNINANGSPPLLRRGRAPLDAHHRCDFTGRGVVTNHYLNSNTIWII